MPQGPEDGNKDKILEIPESKYEDQIQTSPVVSCAQNVLLQSSTQPPAKKLRTASPSRVSVGGVAQGATSPRAPAKNHASPPQYRSIALPKAVGSALQSLPPPAIIGQQGGSTTVHNISSASFQSLAAVLGLPGVQRSGSASEMLSRGINVTGDLTQLLLAETSVSAPSSVVVTCSMQTIPTVTAALPQRVVVSSDASLAVLGPETVNALKQQQQQASVSIAGPVPCDNITSVHSYSLASVSTCSSAPSGSPQKSEPKRTVTSGMHPLTPNPRTAPKRPRVTPQSPSDNSPVHSTIVSELIVCLRKANKVLYRVPDDVAGCDPKVKTAAPASRPKKIKMEKIPVSEEILQKRQKILLALSKKNDLLRRCYYNRHTEMWCLKNKCYLDYFKIMKNPPPALEEHLKSNLYTGDSEQELKKLQEILATPGGLMPVVPPFLQHQKNTPAKSQVSPSKSNQNTTASSQSRSSPSHAPSTPQGLAGLKVVSSSTPIASTTVTKAIKQPLVSPRFSVKNNSLSAVYDSSIGSQEEIVERAKQEAYVMQRIGELRKEGLWSLKRLPKVQETPRSKAHWDYLLEEMVWLATDFAQERKWKKAAAKKCSRMIVKYFQEKEMRVEKAEKEVHMRVRRIASAMAKEIRSFWTNIEKLVEYKQQTWLDAKKKKVLDSHLNFIVDQTEKYSSWLTQGLNRTIMESNGTSRASSPAAEIKISRLKRSCDDDFHPDDSDEDNEETIDKEGAVGDEEEEIKLLQEESMLPLEDLLETLPKEILEKPAPILDSCSNDSESEESSSDETEERDLDNGIKKEDEDDEEFKVPSSEADEPDDEETLLEQEEKEKDVDYSSEIKKLQEESEVPIEELFKKYEDAFGSECEISGIEDMSEDDDGLKSLEEIVMDVKSETPAGQSAEKSDRFKSSEKSPSKEITDIAATAESFQPKGNTLSTTKVCTKVPFLLKHQLREYQHIGLDWLNAMFEKKLNGILADEMGLGKTIQTIALLANLACEKGNWGPHLIVVPTSVMLNWEMEFKKWCPGFKILTYYGSPKERKQKRMGWTKPNAFHVCITSYKLVVQDHQSFRRKKWVYLILDEAQHIKNFKSQRWQMLLNFQSTHRLLLTGTPLQNNLMELWSLMHFLMPNVFQSHKDFREWFVNPVTGMIEGNHEYNESLIKRLHKVLRPFLLRRLKSEVEKQLPKKYEHIIMCRLSKRQRYLYDDFMAQTKTKETLATGNFMSVINILMQLRKVCNHPNMFDPRPTVSPFILPSITYYSASCVWGALDYDPFRHIDLQSMNFLLADTELYITAFGSHRMKSFQLQPHMIEVIDNSADPMTLPAGKIKITVSGMQNLQVGGGLNSHYLRQFTSPSHAQGSNAISRGIITPNTTIPSNQRYVTVANQQHPASAVRQRMGNPVPTVTAGQQVVGQTNPEYTLQVVQQPSQGPPIAQLTPMVASQPFAVQLSPGARMPLGVGRLVQTSSGQHLIITPSVPASVSSTSADIPSVSAAVAYTSAVQNSISNSVPNVSITSQNIATVLPQMQRQPQTAVTPPVISAFTRSTSVNSVSSITTTVQQSSNKPIGRVAPLNVNSSATAQIVPTVKTRPLVNSPVRSPVKTKIDLSAASRVLEKNERGPFHMESVSARRKEDKRERMRLIYKFNPFRCDACPIYGRDLVQSVTMVNDMKNLSRGESHWKRAGYVNCLNAAYVAEETHTFDQHTRHLLEIVQTPEKILESLNEIIKRFVFVTPAAMAPPIDLHVSHPHPSKLYSEKRRIQVLNSELSDPCLFLHPIRRNTVTQFPELRLIEYDCGKLQNLARLLHNLKAGSHRVLIFTQMTRMLDILEQFLCYHGHTYLRLDGTTKVEQRQALMERFNADKKIFCFILSTRSGGIGVNLTGADTVIFYDSDWNPTMDAQAQDRCHRIGQTRDVHIYRLISERTVEENILKKANQKRLLGNLAIEGGNFTTAFFKRNTLHEIFGLGGQEESVRAAFSLLNDASIENMQQSPDASVDVPPEQFSEAQLEQALGMAEEELDLAAAKTAKDEAAAELAEFDESIPFDNDSRDNEEKTPAEEELDRLMDQLKPIERYAVRFCESLQEPVSLEQLKQAEEEIEAKKKDWELGRLKALQEEHERRSKQENLLANDDPLLCYSRDTMMNQVFISMNGLEEMPMWAPPTPPQDDNDLYIDYNMGLLYEQTPMPESRLPPVTVKKEAKRIKLDPAVPGTSLPIVTTRKQKVRKDDITIPRSLFDRPTAAILKMRREAKLQRVRGLIGGVGLHKTLPSLGLKQAATSAGIVVNKPAFESQQDNPEWLVHEDWALLQVIQDLQGLPLTLTVVQPGHIPNWDLCADVVNTVSRVYRSAKQCRNRYESVIVPREEGKILYDTNPKKQKKTKGIYKTKNNRPMRTSQLYLQDNNSSFTSLCNVRFDCLTTVAKRRAPVVKPWLTPTVKNSKHASILVDAGINYDQPLTPVQVAAIRAERIAREKPKSQSNAAIAALASSNLRASQRVNVSTTGGGTTTMTVQEMVAAAAAGQVRGLTTGAVTTSASVAPAVVSVAGLTAVHVQTSNQRLTASGLATTTGTTPLTQLNPQVTHRNLTQLAQIQSFRQTALLRQREQTLKQQQLKRLQAQQQQVSQQATVTGKVVAGTVAASGATIPIVAAAQQRIAQQQAASMKPAVSRTVTEAEMAQIVKRQQQLQQQKHAQLTTAQILAQAQLQQVQQQQQQQQQQQTAVATSALQTSMATLVKTVSAPSLGGASSVAIPVSAVSAGGVNITLPQVMTKSVGGQTKGTATITNQQLRQLQLQQQLLLQARKGSKVTNLSQLTKVQGKSGGLGASALSSPLNTIQVIQGAQATAGQQAKSLQTAMTVHQLQQAMKQVLPQSIPVTSTTQSGVTTITQSQLLSQHAVLSAAAAAAASMKSGTTVSLAAHPTSVSIATTVATLQTLTAATATPGTRIIPVSSTNANVSTTSAQAIKQAIQVVSATPTLSATLQAQPGLRGEPSIAGTVKSQITSLPSSTLTTTSMLKGTSTVVVGQQQTAALLQQVAASSASGLSPHHAVTLAVRAAASQAQGQQQVQIQVQPSHSSLVAQQSIQSTQARIQQLPLGQTTINIAQTVPVQASATQGGSITALPADSATLQQPTHVVMQNVTPTNSQAASPITMPAALSPAPTTAQVVQAAIQAARQQQQQQQNKAASPYTMRLRNPPK